MRLLEQRKNDFRSLVSKRRSSFWGVPQNGSSTLGAVIDHTPRCGQRLRDAFLDQQARVIFTSLQVKSLTHSTGTPRIYLITEPPMFAAKQGGVA